jgi:hypothetical protein
MDVMTSLSIQQELPDNVIRQRSALAWVLAVPSLIAKIISELRSKEKFIIILSLIIIAYTSTFTNASWNLINDAIVAG